MRNKLTKFLTSECPPKGMRQFAKTWKYAACMLLAFILGTGQMWGVDYSPLNYNGGSDLPSGYKYYGSSAGTENKSAFSITTYEGHTVFDVTAGGTGAYNKRAIEFTVSEDCTLDIEFYVGGDGRILNLFHGNSTVVHSSTGTTKGDNKYTFSYSFEDITSDQTYSLSGSGSKVYISKITFAPAVACTETAPTSVTVSGGATYDKGDALSNLSATVTGGSGTMSYQWYRNTADAATVNKDLKLANCTTATLTPSNKVGTYYYYCVASNCAGSVTSGTTSVTINANCSATGDIFTMTMNSSNAPSSEVKTPASSTMSIDTYINIDGGDIVLVTGSSQHSSITTTPRIKLGGSSGYAQITLDCPLQKGDKITFEKTNKIALAADASGTNKIQLASGTNEYTVTKEDCLYNQSNLFVLRDGNNVEISAITITRPVYRTITLEYADGETADGSLDAEDGKPASKPADPTWAHHRFDGWYNGATPYDWTANVTGDLTLTAHWTQLYTISFNNGGGSGDAPATIADKAQGETFTVPANTYTAPDGKVFEKWNDGINDYDPDDTYTVETNNVTLTAVWRTPSTMYAITKGAHENGDFTIAPASQEAGEIVTLEATPDDGYLFSAWEVVKTEDASATGITVGANGQFTMPGYAVTVNATFVADTRAKVLYVTNNNETTTKASDKLYEALKDDYRVTIVGPASTETVTNYALVVLHESVGGSNYNATAVAAAKGGAVPVLNTKSYFYNDGRWNWGTPNAGKTIKGATLNSAYCNIANHPLFSGVAMTDGFFEITDDAAAKCMQPIGSFVAGKEGYTLATTPNNDSGEGCAIHELTPEQRGVASGKYLMISVLGDKLSALNANGQKLFQNAAAYLIDGTASWTPVAVPTSPVVAATPTENYTEGGTITLTASAEGTSASTVYTWYKGADWATASATTPVQAASTSGATFSKTAAVEDAGTYWCNISNGTSCDAQASVTITVSSASTPTHTISYDNVKGADMTAYPTEYTEGIGVASFDPLADITGWHFVEWSPASIATDATTDQTITAVWAQVFEVTFNLKGHGAEIAKQDIISGEKATEPTAPSAIGYDFGGWYTDEECTAGNEFDFNTPITAATPLYAKWTAFDGCTLLVPATSGDAPAVGDPISMQTGSKGGSMSVVGTPLSYNAYGLSFESSSSAKAKVTINNEIQEGTVISLTLVANGTSAPRGLHLYTGDGATKIESLGWNSEVVKYTEATFTYTVKATDVALIGSNEFQLWRNGSVFLKKLTVTNCGDAITFHNLTSAVNIAGKGTVTLGASSVREGYTTTATYSEIDPLYEFVNWTVSGAGATIENATANPATITMGTENAVVTLNLQLIPVKYTVNYFDGTTPMGTEQVAVNEHPTASEIVTAKRHYTFLGWSDTDGGDVVALNTITRTEAGTVTLYAKYEAVVCPTSGTIFSMESDEAKKPASTVTIAKDASIDLAEYATISGGNAMIINGETSGKDAISTDGEFLLKATKEVMKIELNCVLQEGDIIRIPDNSAKLVISTSNAKTGTYQAFADKNTHEFAVTAAWAGVDDIYVLYDGSSLKFTKVYVIRPAKYDVSFNMMGHGSAIADLEDVVDGSKIAAPSPAPTDVDYSFAGWYKENTLENEWDFDVDVVVATTTLYAKWLDKSDATLKSLKYGSTEIELQAGVYTYAVELPSLTTSVPALTAVTNNPNASAVITNDDAFDGEGNASSTVEVTPEKEGATHQTYTVNFTKLPSMPLLDVENSIVWNFANAGTQNNAFTDEVLANFPGVTNDATFSAQTLKASGAKIKDGYLQGTPILFHATKAGLLRVEFANTGGGTRPYRYLVVNGERTAYKSNNTTHVTTAWIEVPAGDVTIEGECVEDANGACTSDNLNFYKIEFLAENTARARTLTVGNLGTTCIENACIVRGAEIYEIKGKNDIGKIVFDQLGADEVLEAGHPYVMVAKEANIRFFNTIADPATEPYNAGNGLIGTFVQKEFAAGDESDGLYFFKDHALWAAKETGMTIPAYRCYLNMNAVGTFSGGAPAPGRHRITMDVHGQNAATGIGNVQGDEVQSTKVLINGELFILRGEKMYDATGRMVK